MDEFGLAHRNSTVRPSPPHRHGRGDSSGPASLRWNVTYGLNSFGCGWRGRGAGFKFVSNRPNWIHACGTLHSLWAMDVEPRPRAS
jgi:hypothetical protein